MNRKDKITLLKDVAAGKISKEELTGEVVVIRTFYDHLKFTNTKGRKPEDFKKAIIAPGPYKDALDKIINNK